MLCNNQTRYVIITVCTYIYKNKPKHNLLQTCKFIHRLKPKIFFYQQVKVKSSNKNINQYTNIIIIKQNFFKSNKLNLSENLRRLTIEGNFTYGFNATSLPIGLTYLKFLNLPKFDYISHRLPPKLKCLILDHNLTTEVYNTDTKISILQSSIKHLVLGTSFDKFSLGQIKKIIPKNITHLGFINYNIFDILHEYKFLTKITIQKNDQFSPNLLHMIPQNIAHLCINNYISDLDFHQIFTNPRCTTANQICPFAKNIPKHITKLKLDRLTTAYAMPKTIQELYIGKILCVGDKLLKIRFNVKKLTIKQDDEKLLDLAPNENRKIKYII